jgi:hypothetical protein
MRTWNTGVFPFADLIAHRCALGDAHGALDLVSSGTAGKIVNSPQMTGGIAGRGKNARIHDIGFILN